MISTTITAGVTGKACDELAGTADWNNVANGYPFPVSTKDKDEAEGKTEPTA